MTTKPKPKTEKELMIEAGAVWDSVVEAGKGEPESKDAVEELDAFIKKVKEAVDELEIIRFKIVSLRPPKVPSDVLDLTERYYRDMMDLRRHYDGHTYSTGESHDSEIVCVDKVLEAIEPFHDGYE